MPILWEPPLTTADLYRRYPGFISICLLNLMVRHPMDLEVEEIEQEVFLRMINTGRIFQAHFAERVNPSERENLWKEWFQTKVEGAYSSYRQYRGGLDAD